MLCVECLHAHIPSHSPTPSHMLMPSITTVPSSTNDTHILSPYWLTSTQCKCQWTTNPESILTPITQLEVYVITVCLIFGQWNVSDHTAGLLHPCSSDKHDRVSSFGNRTFRITPRVSYTNVPSFSLERVNGPLLALPNTHYLYFFLCFKP